MSISYTDIGNALRAAGHNPDDCKVSHDSPGPGWTDITSTLNLPRGVLRDLAADGLEVYAPPTPPPSAPSLPPKPPVVDKVKAATHSARGTRQ
jgi:hypothetical protein